MVRRAVVDIGPSAFRKSRRGRRNLSATYRCVNGNQELADPRVRYMSRLNTWSELMTGTTVQFIDGTVEGLTFACSGYREYCRYMMGSMRLA